MTPYPLILDISIPDTLTPPPDDLQWSQKVPKIKMDGGKNKKMVSVMATRRWTTISPKKIHTEVWNASTPDVVPTSEMRNELCFEYLDSTQQGFITVEGLYLELEKAGLRRDDPRLASLDTLPERVHLSDLETLSLNCLELIQKCCQNTLRMPNFSSFCQDVREIYDETRGIEHGTVPTAFDAYSLDQTNANEYAVAIASVDGQRFSLGNAHQRIQIDGCCKPLLYCMAKEQVGAELDRYLSSEPSGLDAHALSLQSIEGKKRPHNPLMSSGALVCCSFIQREKTLEERLTALTEFIEAFFNRSCPMVQQKVNIACAENSISSRNRCLAYMLEDAECFPPNTNLDDVLELFYRGCGTQCTTDELALMAATLANGGVCPMTNQRLLSAATVHQCLSVMYSSGLGTYSGEWAFHVGLPATSSIGGNVMVVVPGVMGMSSFSPRTDDSHNSTRGVQFFKLFVQRFNFHSFDTLPGINLLKKDHRQDSKMCSQELNQKLLSAAADGDVCEIRRLRSRGADLNGYDYDNRTALHLAASEGKMSVVKYLIRHGVELNPVDRWGGTPLFDAKRSGYRHIVNILTQAGVENTCALSSSRRNSEHESIPLGILDMSCFYAALNGQVDELRRLKEQGGNLMARDYDGRTPLHLAASEGHAEVVRYLLDQKADGSALDRYGRTPLSCAKEHGYRDVIQSIKRSGDSIFSDDESAIAVGDSSDEEDDADDYEVSSHSASQLFAPSSMSEGIFRVRELITALRKNGLLETDPRLKKMIDNARILGPETILSYDQYRYITESGAILLEKALLGTLIIPEFDDFCDEIADVFEAAKVHDGGHVADYIPQLSQVDPNKFAVSVCTIDGQRFSLGDSSESFCVQSCSKPISYCIALEELGSEKVHYHIGTEPSGLRFNELSLMEVDGERLPHNPMINAGAIMTSSLIKRQWPLHKRFEYVMNVWHELCGRSKVDFNNSVCLSERATADRNFCLGYMMREADCLPEDTNLPETLEFYFEQCAISLNTEQLSVVAATLANGGVCPITNQRIFSAENVRNCLSLMSSCGMYDYSGSWAFNVGVPAKSGVSGAIMIVIPNVMGFCVWSPRLDACGNSVRGIAFVEELVKRCGFHMFDHLLLQQKRKSYVAPQDSSSSKQKHIPRHHLVLYAAAAGDVDRLRQLKLGGADLTAVDYDGRTALHLAAAESHLKAVEYLIAQGANLNAVDRWGGTPLSDAKKYQHESIIKCLNKYS